MIEKALRRWAVLLYSGASASSGECHTMLSDPSKRLRWLFSSANVVTGATLTLILFLHRAVTEDHMLQLSYYLAIGMACYALVKRDEIRRMVVVVGAMMATMSVQVHFGPEIAENATLDETADFMTWCMLLVIFWMVGRHAYMLQSEAHKLRSQLQLDELATEARKAAFACAAHEIRTPLNGIVCSAETLLTHMGENLSEDEHAFLKQIHDCGLHLNSLLQDMLDYVKGRAGQIDLSCEPLVLHEVVEDCVGFVKSHATQLDVTIASNWQLQDNEIVADRMRLRQVILNLLSNAIKYSPRGGTIEVGIANDGEDVLISIADEGPGMTAVQLNELFTPFYEREDSGFVTGTGLGLGISKLLVEQHSGSIDVATHPGRGSCFTIRLPLSTTTKRSEIPCTWNSATGREDTGVQAERDEPTEALVR